VKVSEAHGTTSSRPWSFLTNHAHVILCIARDPKIRARDIAEQIGITERAAQRILADLIADGYVTRAKAGRRNHYTIDPRAHLRHPVYRDLTLGPLLEVLTNDSQPKTRPASRPRHRP
jgi:MarR family protein